MNIWRNDRAAVDLLPQGRSYRPPPPCPCSLGPEELKKKIEEYNAEHPERPAYSLEVEPGSLTEYLLGKIQAEARRSDEAIEEALDALDTARDCVRSLQK